MSISPLNGIIANAMVQAQTTMPVKPPETVHSQFAKVLESKGTPLTEIVHNIESGGLKVDAMLNSVFKGKQYNNTELLAMQAGLYRYTQELDLCTKVVEKAVNGLRDVLKTQV